MKKILIPVAAMVAVGAVACADQPTTVAPDGANFELVDPELRRASGNASVIASFSYTIPGQPGIRAGEAGVNSDGKEIGWCHEDGTGKWQNPSNKRWAAAVPHAHCLDEEAAERIISLEAITSFYEAKEQTTGGLSPRTFTIEKLELSNDSDDYKVEWNSNSGEMTGKGVIRAVAVDQGGQEHGEFDFNLADFSGSTNYFAEYEASVEGGGICVFGLSKTITATYFAPGAGDDEGVQVPGTLYWQVVNGDCPSAD